MKTEIGKPLRDDDIQGLIDETLAGAVDCGGEAEVDAVVQVDGPCRVYPMGDDQYMLNTWTEGKPAHSHFAVVTANADGAASAPWNADLDHDPALDPLGMVRKHGDC